MNRVIEGSELPYLTRPPDGGRCIIAMAYYDDVEEQFECYAGQPGGKFLPLRPRTMIWGRYVAKSPADSARDVHLPFSETAFQHFSLPNMWSLVDQLDHDLENALSSLHKYFVILRHAQATDDGTAGSLISTEVEYAIGNHRSFYDVIQRVVMAINSTYHAHPCRLKDSFAKLAQKETEYLCSRLQLPAPIARFYKSRAALFLLLRDIRDDIFHHGHSPGTVFVFEDGLAVRVADRFNRRLKGLELWPEHLLKPNAIGAVLAVLELIVRDMLDTMQNLGTALIDSFEELPLAVAEEYHVYLRSPLARHFHLLPMYKQKHWFNPDDILTQFLESAPDD